MKIPEQVYMNKTTGDLIVVGELSVRGPVKFVAIDNDGDFDLGLASNLLSQYDYLGLLSEEETK